MNLFDRLLRFVALLCLAVSYLCVLAVFSSAHAASSTLYFDCNDYFSPDKTCTKQTAVVTALTCATVKTALATAIAKNTAGVTLGACTSDPMIIGARITGIQGGESTYRYTLSLISPVCAAGYHLDTITNSCVNDLSTSLASCMPAIVTVSPCPSGYAPTMAIPTGAITTSSITSEFQSLPIQDMLYALGMAVCGLLGITTGVRLT